MRSVALAFGLIGVCMLPFAEAGQFKIDGIVVEVPKTFDGPTIARPDARAQTHVFAAWSNSPLVPSSVLQITEYGAATDANAGRPEAVSQQYLLQMLEGIERRRTEYRASAPVGIRVAGLPGSVVSWLSACA